MRVYVQDDKEANYLTQLEKENIFDFWSDSKAEHHVDIMTSPDMVDSLESRLKEHKVNWTVLNSNVQSLIDAEKIPSEPKLDKPILAHKMDWVEYHSLEDIYEWFDYLETKYEFCEQEIIGESYEGREMRVMKVNIIMKHQKLKDNTRPGVQQCQAQGLVFCP